MIKQFDFDITFDNCILCQKQVWFIEDMSRITEIMYALFPFGKRSGDGSAFCIGCWAENQYLFNVEFGENPYLDEDYKRSLNERSPGN